MFAHLSAETARTYGLVLASAGIAHTVEHQPEGWTVTVPAPERLVAQRVIRLYLLENRSLPQSPACPRHEAHHPFSAIGAALLLLAVQLATSSDAHHQQLITALGADARKIMEGELYRCITALLLHSGWPHLITNMAAIVMFGTFTVLAYGWGIGWLMILLSGALGNFLTAAWHSRFHLAVGASTAIFGAVGLCAMATFWRHLKMDTLQWRSWIPLAAGLALVGWLGTSPQADLVAHFTGFLSGLVLGGIYGWKIDQPFGGRVQTIAMGFVAALIGSSWYWGYRVG